MCSHPQGSITVALCSCVQDRQNMTEPVLEILQAAHGMSDTGSAPSACGAAVVLLLYWKKLHSDFLIDVQPHLRSILNKSDFLFFLDETMLRELVHTQCKIPSAT